MNFLQTLFHHLFGGAPAQPSAPTPISTPGPSPIPVHAALPVNFSGVDRPLPIGNILQPERKPYHPLRLDPNMPVITPQLDEGGVPTLSIPRIHDMGEPLRKIAPRIT